MLLNNNFNGGPDGTPITTGNTGQFGDAAFNVVNPATGSTLAFADCGVNNLARPTAQYALEIATGGGSAQQPYAAWTTSMGSQTNVYARFYLWFSSVGATTHDQDLFQLYVPGTLVNVSVYLMTSASPIVLGMVNYASATVRGSVTPVAGQWNRVEFFANVNSTNSTGTLRLYSGDDVDTDNITDTVTQTAANFGWTSTGGVAVGQLGATTDAFPSIYLSNLTVNNTGWPGPAPFRQGLGFPAGNLTNPMAIHMV